MKIKILQIIRGLDIGENSGGAEMFGIKLSQKLNKFSDCEVWICAFFSYGTELELEWQNKLNNEGINTQFLTKWGGYNNFFNFYRGLRNLMAFSSKQHFDVCNSHFQLGTLAAVILKTLNFSKTAYRTSHIRSEWNKGKMNWLLFPLFINRVFPKYLNGEIGVSESVFNYLRNRNSNKIDKSKIHLIYNGIDIDLFKKNELKDPKREIIYDNNFKYTIGSIGRLTEQKGYRYLILAMKKVISQLPNCSLQIVGDGELKNELPRFANELGLTDNIQFLGVQNNIPELMSNWNAFILSSLWEGLPTVIMEAMACEVPSIATDIPGTDELIIHEKTGLLVPIKDSEALGNSIIRLLKDKNLQDNLITNAKHRLNKFSMETIAKKYRDLYKTNLH